MKGIVLFVTMDLGIARCRVISWSLHASDSLTYVHVNLNYEERVTPRPWDLSPRRTEGATANCIRRAIDASQFAAMMLLMADALR